MKKTNKKLNNKGFSLVELIIVIAIMAILVGVLSPQLMKYIEKSRYSADMQTLDSAYTALKIALADEEAYSEVESVTDIKAAGGAKFQAILDEDTNKYALEVQEIFGGDKFKFKSKDFTKDDGTNEDIYCKYADGSIKIKITKSGDTTDTIVLPEGVTF